MSGFDFCRSVGLGLGWGWKEGEGEAGRMQCYQEAVADSLAGSP